MTSNPLAEIKQTQEMKLEKKAVEKFGKVTKSGMPRRKNVQAWPTYHKLITEHDYVIVTLLLFFESCK